MLFVYCRWDLSSEKCFKDRKNDEKMMMMMNKGLHQRDYVCRIYFIGKGGGWFSSSDYFVYSVNQGILEWNKRKDGLIITVENCNEKITQGRTGSIKTIKSIKENLRKHTKENRGVADLDIATQTNVERETLLLFKVSVRNVIKPIFKCKADKASVCVRERERERERERVRGNEQWR